MSESEQSGDNSQGDSPQTHSPVASPDADREQSPEEALDIKPPQRHAVKKDRHKHKHKHRTDRVRGERKHGDRDRGLRREDRERDKKQREVETRSREESLRERERLERLEREKNRERELRVRGERERRTREKESRRARAGWRDGREERRHRERNRGDRSRSRSPRREGRAQRDSHSVSKNNSKRPSPKVEEIQSATPQTPEEEEEAVTVEEEEEVEQEIESGEEEEESGEEASEEESGEEEASASDDSRDSGSAESGEETGSDQSEDGSVSEAEEEQRKPKKDKLKSKFDDQSSEEEEDVSAAESTQESEKELPTYLDDTPPASPLELKPELPPYFPAIQGCRNVEEFHCLNRIEEGTYGVVYRARDKKTTEIVALKRLKMEKEKEGFPITSLREINTLLKSQHMNIVTVREIVVGSNMDKIYIVMDYVEHDMKSLMESMKQPFLVGEVKTLLIQLLRAVAHMHDNWILHRDLKTSNLLLSHKGILKVGDFGLAREYGSPLKHYTPIVVTLWYRSPELLLGAKEYSTAVDMWSVGCIFAEFLTMKPLWPGKSEIDQLNKIFKDLGTPSEKIWPGVGELPAMKKCTFADYPYNTLRNRFGAFLSDAGFELLNRFLTYNPSKRISAEDALKVEYFKESPQPIDPSMFPTWPAKSEQPRKHMSTPKPPSGGKAYAMLMGDPDDEVALVTSGPGFHMGSTTKGASSGPMGFSLKF